MTAHEAFENEIATLLGPRYCWALHTEPVRILMAALENERRLSKQLQADKDMLARQKDIAATNHALENRWVRDLIEELHEHICGDDGK